MAADPSTDFQIATASVTSKAFAAVAFEGAKSALLPGSSPTARAGRSGRTLNSMTELNRESASPCLISRR